LDTKKAKKDKCKPFWTHETPFQATHMQENDPNFFYEDAILFGDNDNIWSNTQGDYAYAGNQFPTLPSQCYTQSVPQYSTPQTNPTMADFDVTLDTNFFDPILPTANTSSSNTVQQYPDSNANSLINSSSFAFRTNNELQQHVSLSRLYLPNATPGSQALETPLLDYFQSPATHQPFDSSLLTAQNTPATHDTPINTNTLSFQMDDYYKFFTDSTNGNGTNNSAPSSSSDMTSKPLQSTNSENYINLEYGHSSNGLLFNDTSVWEGFTN
jgi:hypothetical protein